MRKKKIVIGDFKFEQQWTGKLDNILINHILKNKVFFFIDRCGQINKAIIQQTKANLQKLGSLD